MGTEQASAYCKNCNKQVLVTRNTPNHILHLLLSLVTCGLWLLVWWSMSSEKKPWRCSQCGLSLGGGSNGWGVIGSLFSKKPDNFQK